MIAKDRFTLADSYDAAHEFKILTGKQVSLYVFNQPCAYQVLKPPSDGPRGFETQTEEQVSPGTIVFPGASGIRLRNVIAGGGSPQGLCSVRVYDRADVIGVGYVPITTNVTAAGVISAVPVNAYAKSGVAIDVTTPSGNVETDIINVPIKAVDITTTSQFEFMIRGDLLDAVADQNATFRAYIGATKVFDSGAQSIAGGAGFGASRQPFTIRGSLSLRGALNSQWTEAGIVWIKPSVAAPTTGEGNMVVPAGADAVTGLGAGGSAVDMSADQTFRVSFFWAASDANHSFRVFSSLMVLY